MVTCLREINMQAVIGIRSSFFATGIQIGQSSEAVVPDPSPPPFQIEYGFI
jgi:hypothetical protein